MPVIETKEELLRNLNCTKHNFVLGTFGIVHLMNDMLNKKKIPNLAIMPEHQIGINDFGWDAYIKQNEYLLNLDKEFINRFTDAFHSIERNYVKETYESIKAYCLNEINGENQIIPFENRPWYRMATVFRNSLSHDWVLAFGKYDKEHIKKHGSIELYGVNICLKDEGKSLYELSWDRGHTMLLCDDMNAFAKKLKEVK